MKKLLVKLVAIIVVVASVFSFAACGSSAATKYDASKAKVYSMDLTSIAGYEDAKYKVTDGTWAETYDVIISLVKKESDTVKRYQLMHMAEDLLMSTGDIVPIYYYTDIYMIDDSVKGFFSSPLGYKYFMYTTIDGGAKSLPVCIASSPASLDPALNSAVDGATMILHLMSGLVKYDSTGKLAADCATELPVGVANQDGTTTYTFTLRDNLKWSNGEEVKASDFAWSWKRAASTTLGADYGYMFEVVKGYGEDDVNGLAPLEVVADDTNKTLAVTLAVDVPYFYELCAFPAYMPVYNTEAHPIDADGTWATSKDTYICNGAYTITEWLSDQCITLTKNNNYVDKEEVTMDEIKFYLSDDATAMLTNFKAENNRWLMIDDVPNDEIPALKRDYPTEFKVEGQLGTYYICFNNNLDFLPATEENKALSVEDRQKANTEIRNALSLLLDRNYICEKIGQAGQQPASSFVALGLTDPSNGDEQFYQHAGHNAGYVGYYDVAAAAFEANCQKAVTTLKKYFKYNESNGVFTNFPSFTYLYNTNSGHQQIAEYVQSALKVYGINVKLENQEWATFLETRKNGDYGVARNGWLGDYNDPISFLDMWTTASGNNDVQFGK